MYVKNKFSLDACSIDESINIRKLWETIKYNVLKRTIGKMVSRYFHKIGGKFSSRMWDFLNTQSDLSHNQSSTS